MGVEAARRHPSSLVGVSIGALRFWQRLNLFGKPRIMSPRSTGEFFPPRTRLRCGELALETGGDFAGRHGDFGQS